MTCPNTEDVSLWVSLFNVGFPMVLIVVIWAMDKLLRRLEPVE